MTQSKKKGKYETYGGYKLDVSNSNIIDVVDLSDAKVTKEWFYTNYINLRKPAVLKNSEKKPEFLRMDINNFKISNLLNTITDSDQSEKLQVEEINNGGFGSGKRRLKMSLTDFVHRIRNGESLYLTTQYEENESYLGTLDELNDDSEIDDDDEEVGEGFGKFEGFDSESSVDNEFADIDEKDDYDENDQELEQALANEIGSSDALMIYQPPLDRLIPSKSKLLPPVISTLFEPLVPQQINLWCGRTPSQTHQLQVVKKSGHIVDVNRGLPVPNATSTGLHHDHADNLYILVQGQKRFTLFSPDFANKLYTVGDIRHIYDTGVIDYIKNDKAPTWRNVRADGTCISTDNDDSFQDKVDKIDDNEEKSDPPSFCKIPPVLLHLNEVEGEERLLLEKYCDEKFPEFSPIKLSATQVALSDGDLLYLPAGWFHEVTSFGDEANSNIHTAINYWFIPPDGPSIEKPYTDHSYRIEFDEAFEDL